MTTQSTPFTNAPLVGTTAAQVATVNPSRKGIIFFNPSANTVTVYPGLSNTSQQIPINSMIVNGAGGITIVSGGLLALPQPGWPDIGIGVNFFAVASGALTPFTIWEF